MKKIVVTLVVCLAVLCLAGAALGKEKKPKPGPPKFTGLPINQAPSVLKAVS